MELGSRPECRQEGLSLNGAMQEMQRKVLVCERVNQPHPCGLGTLPWVMDSSMQEHLRRSSI